MLDARGHRFNDTTGALTWNYRPAWLHPDACKCQGQDSTPHKHYDNGKCARCTRCNQYDPMKP